MNADIFIHLDNVLFFVAFLFRDMLYLRLLSCGACVSSALYQYYAPETPLMTGIYYDAGFVAVNVYQIAVLLRERARVKFNKQEKELFHRVFYNLKPLEFFKLLTIAQWKTLAAGEVLIEKDSEVKAVTVVHEGTLWVELPDADDIPIEVGGFAGEFAYITGKPASATIIAKEHALIVSWPLDELQKLFKKHEELEYSFRAIISTNLVEKITP